MTSDTTAGVKQTSIPLDDIVSLLGSMVKDIQTDKRSISFSTDLGRTNISVRDVDSHTNTGEKIRDVVTICSEIPATMVDALTVERRPLGNTMATLGALAIDPADGLLKVCSRLVSFGSSSDEQDLHVPLIAYSAWLQADSLIGGIAYSLGNVSGVIDLPYGQEGSYWTEQELRDAAEHLKELGLSVNCSATSLSAEIPLEEGDVSALFGEAASILSFQSDRPHPAIGNGLLVSLELPVEFSEEELEFLVNVLNQQELEGADLPPFFGAWCSEMEGGRIKYISFWPNVLYKPASIKTISGWMLQRHSWAREFIKSTLSDAIVQ